MSILVTSFTLKLLGRTLETFHMFGISTLGTCLSFLVWACLGSNFFLYGGTCWCSLEYHCVTGWAWLEGVFLLVLSWWEVCTLMSHQMDLGCLVVTCNLFDVTCAVAFEASIFLASCLTLLGGNFSKSILLSFMGLDTNSSSFKKNQNMLQCKVFAVSSGCLARDTCACTAL